MSTIKTLTQEIASPSVGGIRSAWTWRPLASMTPASVADILRRASAGDGHDFVLAASDIEEKDLHYGSVLQTRKLALTGLPMKITPKDNTRQAKNAAKLAEDTLSRLDVPDLLIDMLDAVSKGYSVGELMWDTAGMAGAWQVVDVLRREPHWFGWDRDTGTTLKLIDGSAEGMDLPAYKFMLHRPKIRSGIPLMGGLARSALWAWVFKSYALRDWAAFCELFGQPLRVGKYGAAASKEDIAVLRRAVTEIGSDAGAVIPDSMMIDFVESGSKTSTADLYLKLVTYMDNQISKAVLGQTGTTDMGGSYAQSKIHNEVRTDLLHADARAAAATLTRQLIQPVITLNMGADVPMPQFALVGEEPEDMAALADQLDKLVPLGLQVEQSWVRTKWGIPEPAQGAVLLGRAASAPSEPPPDPTQTASQSQQSQDPATPLPQPLPLSDVYQTEVDEGWTLMEPLLAPIQAAMNEATAKGETAAQLLERLGRILPQMDGTALTAALTRTAFAAHLSGVGGVDAD